MLFDAPFPRWDRRSLSQFTPPFNQTGALHFRTQLGAAVERGRVIYVATPHASPSQLPVENVKLLDRYIGKKPANGILYLTATHLIYVEASGASRKETWIALHHIATVEKLPITSTGCPLILRCKNFRIAQFVLDSDLVCHEVYISLLKLSQPETRENGWKLIDPISDFGRMGIPNRYWTITDANRNYEICSTYPPEIVVPRSITLGTVVGSSKFRSKERVPVLSYLYKENNAAICRCSQPLSGFYTRCVDDELLLEAISQTNPGSQFMYVVDTRPKLNAMANRAAGKGYENEDNYANIRFKFMGIENIHVMRNSLQKLLEVCELKTPTMSEFLSGLENSGWLRHIKAIMDAGVFITKAVKVEKANVLVHCSDGWDRTAQVCSVASILLDPFYRTFKGLMILIEKEWISMGHKFSQRCGHLDGDSKEVSPIFTQFLDCIWQLMQQFPCAFEFNEKFLLEIHDHIFSCQFGNFLGNCQKDREDLRVYEKTHSVWPFLVQRKPDFRNPLYKGFTTYRVLNPSTVPYNIQFWCGMYNRFDKGLQPKQNMLESLLEIKKQRAMLEADVHELQKKLKAHDEPPEDVCTCSQLGNLLSQHLGSPLTNPLSFMGIDGDLNTLMENGTLSREGGLRAQMDQAKSQCEDLHHDCYGLTDSLRSINVSGDVDIFGPMGVSGDTDISEAMGIPDISKTRGFSEDMHISEAMDIVGDMSISEGTVIYKASTKEAGCVKQQ
ncbi:phosphatidylinositol-3,5-bisphosphate 3-phosphatase MTMR8 isoform X2 [Castor canadensis]|uniref:Phosphatidylinositol-3,5-bisphosphate 3-phosphatase MTMR8 isoform X2 n=1 Tax=Castor canadensis TaxID=51338 RepID=A0AC58LSS5_CASCN